VSDAHLHPGFVKISPKRNNNGTNRYHAFRWSTRKVETESHNLAFLETPSSWKVYTKVRDVDSAALKDIVTDITTNEGSTDIERLGLDSKWFDYPKPVSLIKVLVEAASSKDAIVLDFFAGSATTAQAVMELNADDGGSRRFIQVQLPEPLSEDSEGRKAGFATIADVAAARIRAVADHTKSKTEGRLDTTGPSDFGFRAYKLADTNFAKWRLSSDVEEEALQLHLLSLRDSATDDASADDLLTEILLKQGYSLTEDIAPAEVGDLDVRLVRDRDGDVAVLAYLNEHVKPTLEQLRALVDESPTRIIVLEDAFQGDDELKTNLAQLCKSKGIELWTA
jgi:adenine-specific DNA-methyltransferase